MKETVFKNLLQVGFEQALGDFSPVDTCCADGLVICNFYTFNYYIIN